MSRPVLVYGAGALGSLLGALLSRRTRVCLLARPAHAGAIRAQGGVRLDGCAPGLYPVEAVSEMGELPASALVLVTVKAFDLQAALGQLAPGLDSSHLVVVLQNGLGIRSLAETTLGREVVRAVTFMAAEVVEPGRVTFSAAGKTYFPTNGELMKLWQEAHMPAEQVGDITTYVWRKLAINAAINPLSALLGVANGELVTLGATTRALVEELVEVARREGQTLEVGATHDKVLASMRQTARNHSSMLQDVRAGRQTEIDWINGAVVRLATAHGLDAPRHRLLVELVHFLEQRGVPRPLSRRVAV